MNYITKLLKKNIMQNKRSNIKFNQESEKGMLYSELINIVIGQSQMQEGATIKEMRLVMKLSETLETLKEDDECEFTIEQLDFIKSKMIPFKWGVIHQDIIDLYAELDIE